MPLSRGEDKDSNGDDGEGGGGDPLREGTHPVYVLELFHGPTLSFKDVAMGRGAPCAVRRVP